MLKNLLLTGVAGAALLLSACGGGGGSSDSGSDSGTGGTGGTGGIPTASTKVTGPLDTAQTSLSNSVLAPLVTATAGTPLSGLLSCADVTINQNTLDIIDGILNGLRNPATLASTTPAQVQTQVFQLSRNLTTLLTSLGGSGECDPDAVGSAAGSNPLAGTPLAPLGAAVLPVLQQIQTQLGPRAGGSATQSGFASIAALVAQLDAAFASGLSQLPDSAISAPVVGGVLTTVDGTLGDLSTVLNALAANNGPALTTALQNTVDHLLVNVLTKIVPTEFIEGQAGQPGVISGQVQNAAAQLSAALGTALGSLTTPLTAVLGSSQLAPVLDPVLNQLLPALINPITQALSGNLGTPGSSATGTPLDAVLAPLTTVLGTILGGVGGGVGGGIGGGPGGSGTCVFASIPLLNVLCR